MASPTEEIKEKLDIVDVIRSYIEVHPAGRNFKARCPFHTERTPSFMISPERQAWHCFGCGEGGDIFTFVMKYENIEFSEALKMLAEKAGVDLRQSSPADHQQFGVLYDINRMACDVFKYAFERHARAKEYVDSRGLTEEMVELFEVGFAPEGYDTLVTYLVKKGYKIDDVVRAGLAVRTERGKYLDRFRGRVMFPIHNHFGKIVGFSGRILPELDTGEMGKYVNSPETPIFNKSRLLYGFWQSKTAIRDTKTAVLVEGQMDFLMLYRDGVHNVVASSGTALTLDHLRTLKRFAETLVIIFDNDDAGRMAAERGIDMAAEFDISVRVVPLSEYKDPADAVFANPGFMAGKIAQARTAMEYYFELFLSQEEDREKRKQHIRKVLGKIKKLSSPIDRVHWIKELSFRVHISEKDLLAEMESLGDSSGLPNRHGTESETIHTPDDMLPKDRVGKISWRLFELAHMDNALLERLTENYDFLPDVYKKGHDALRNGSSEDASVGHFLDMIHLRASILTTQPGHAPEEEFDLLVRELISEFYKKEMEGAQYRIATAESEGDEEALKQYLAQFDGLSRKMQDVKNGKKQ